MKIKLFEDYNLNVGKYYWKIKSLPQDYKLYLTKYLKKINCPDDVISKMIMQVKYLDKDNPLYIRLIITEYKEIWNLTKIQSNYLNNIYNGEINLNEQDLKDIEIEKNAEKYNI